MTDTIDQLRERMEAAAAGMDFEQARILRDRINLLRGGTPDADAATADTAGLTRQRAGAMGLGTGQPRVAPPPGWTPPPRPDPMTSGRSRRGGRR